jgi:hypothetical protein
MLNTWRQWEEPSVATVTWTLLRNSSALLTRLPDVRGISQYIFDEVSSYLSENLSKLGLDESQVGAVVFAVQEELRAERGPDFYKLPVLFGELGMSEDAQWTVLHELQDFLSYQLINAVKFVEGVPQDIKTVMVRALKGALDFVINDIAPAGSLNVDFFALLPVFSERVKMILLKDLLAIEFTNEQLVDEVINEVGW